MTKKYKKQIYQNYVNTRDKLLGDIDKIRAETQEDVSGMSFRQELEFRQSKVAQGLKGTGFVYETNPRTGIGYIKDRNKARHQVSK
ncbi:hypothetical protein L6278_03210 [Candidatus Parcubacteria bacterium]|nr:hypothetical protein [Candidatus Parcubacteria bacterium]